MARCVYPQIFLGFSEYALQAMSNRRAAKYQLSKQTTANILKERPVSESVNDSIPFTSENSLEPGRILELFKQSFSQILLSPDLQEHIQTVKGNLYDRDYLVAFDNDDKRFAYASRWSPARSLAYASLFASLEPIVELLSSPEENIEALCIGAGASSELVGLGAVFCRLKESHSTSPSLLHLNIVDIANWSTVVSHVTKHIKDNWVYREEKFNSSFLYKDILDENVSLRLSQQSLITLLFTTNELFTEKKRETMKFLQRLNVKCKTGTFLLIAESAGSYSHITVGTKTFPVQFLIDTILCGKPNEAGPWEIVKQSESCWYRINTKEVDYPMKLENMRFFYRLYRKN